MECYQTNITYPLKEFFKLQKQFCLLKSIFSFSFLYKAEKITLLTLLLIILIN